MRILHLAIPAALITVGALLFLLHHEPSNAPDSTPVIAMERGSEPAPKEAPVIPKPGSAPAPGRGHAAGPSPQQEQRSVLPFPTTPAEVDAMLHRFHAGVPVSSFFGFVDGLLLSKPEPDTWTERVESALKTSVAANGNLRWNELICRQGICKLSLAVKAPGTEMTAFIDFGDEVHRLMQILPTASLGNGMETGGFYYYLFNTDPAAPYVAALYEELLPELEAIERRQHSR